MSSVVFRFVSHIEGDLFKAWRSRMRTCLFSLLPVFERFFSRFVVFGNDDSSGNSSMLLHEEETLVSVLGGKSVIILFYSLTILVNTVHILIIVNTY